LKSSLPNSSFPETNRPQKTVVKQILFALLMVLMLLPLVQHGTKIFKLKPLDGDFVLQPRPAFDWGQWMDGTFQSTFDRYLEDHIGFRNFFVRLNNQIDFSLYDKAKAEGVMIGKDNVLYEYDYIRAYTGGDFLGVAYLTEKLNRLKFVQDYLHENYNIDFIFILEPSKARTLPQYIPDRYFREGRSMTNYEYIAAKADSLGINYLDLNKIFVAAADTARWPLYPPYGIHWSEGTMPFVADTLIHFLEEMRGIDMPEYSVSFTYTDSISDSDTDVGRTLNLLFDLSHPKMVYPHFSFYDQPDKERPHVLAVADSYYWNFFNTRIPQHLFANQAFWYFNAKVYPDFYFGEKWTRDLDIEKEVLSQEILLLSITERFLYKFDWGFVDQLYAMFTPTYSGDFIEKQEDAIRTDAVWFDDLVKDAKTSNLPLHTVLRQAADFQALQENRELYLTWNGLEYYERTISGDEAWSRSVKDKATQNNISYEEQLRDDALWTFQNEHPAIYAKYLAIHEFMGQIKSDSAWLQKVAEKANFYRMPLERMIAIDAEYLYNQNQQDPLQERISYYENLIRSTPEWLESVTRKAAEQNRTPEEMIKMDAKYMAEQEQK
jgi:hypothetical protein